MWLDAYSSDVFQAFSSPHLVWIGIIAAVVWLLFVLRHQIRSRDKLRAWLRWLLAAILLASEVCLQCWYIQQQVWDASRTLPLELCSITLLLSSVMLMTRSRLLYQFLFFAGIAGALQAVVTPNLAYDFPHFRFIQFFVAHAAIILASLYMTWVEGCRPTWKSIGLAMLFLNGCALIVWIADLLLDANYMFLRGKPDTPSLLDLLGPYPYYILAEEAVAFMFFSCMLLLFKLLSGKRESASEEITA
ncbi:TIGR02206 family membrane protein [Paenibacillus sp. P96]|uniref:TIGR02206 family membrane protein n=1 Tax=Paenibacillus zeirhizosphaerae TaxID=2987519 RepID=A0ABT9FWE6_9BACL|nr:TIGR02206 family membrane protein [Paenibacillus sp. P96]MDP4099052.1 TIGR02206 family membrane protein [Paenibacillus sp. P96]